MNYNISIYSTALFSTWINVEELNLLIDAGDGVTAGLLSKSRKIKNVFIPHPDRDHLNGLPQFVQLNARKNYPLIHYPKDSGSFPAMQDFLNKFDPHVVETQWIGIKDGQVIPINKRYEVKAIHNEHVKAPIGVHKSLSYILYETKNKLKSEFRDLNPEQIKQIALTKGRDHFTQTIKRKIISFSGDTPVDDYNKWDGSDILIHESTFLKTESDSMIESRGNKHSTLEQVMKMASDIDLNVLILNHFSSRYSNEDINTAVKNQIKDLSIKIPVYVVYPGEIKRDILKSKPINS